MSALFSSDAFIFYVLFLVRPFIDNGAGLRDVSVFFFSVCVQNVTCQSSQFSYHITLLIKKRLQMDFRNNREPIATTITDKKHTQVYIVLYISLYKSSTVQSHKVNDVHDY